MANYLLGVYEKGMPAELGFEEKLKEAAAAGYDFMELSLDETDEKLARLDWDSAEAEKLRRAAVCAGVPVMSFCLSGHRRFPFGGPDAEVRRRSLEIMEKAIVLAARLGARIIQLAGYDVYYQKSSDETLKYFQENLFKATHMAARQGVTLGFETMETPFMDTVQKASAWVRRVNSPFLQIYPDCGNLWNAAVQYGVPVVDDMESGRGHLVALHLKETKPGSYREVPYGEGHVNFAAVAGKALEMGVRLFNAEFWYTGEENWRSIMRSNSQFLRRALGG